MTRRFDNITEIVELLRRLDAPPTVAELLQASKDHFGVATLTGRWLARLVERSDGQLAIGSDGLVRSPSVAPQRPESLGLGDVDRPLRLVALDFETLPRHRADGTVERVPFEVGALRFGQDEDWVKAAKPFEALIIVDPMLAEVHPNSRPVADAVANGSPAEAVANDLAAVLDGADAAVAYNADEVDEPVARQLLGGAHDQLVARLVFVDALYLTYAVWPRRAPVKLPCGRSTSAHTLEAVAHRAGLKATQTHRALDDCRLLVDVLAATAARLEAWPNGLEELIAAATRNSQAWQLLLAMRDPPTPRHPLTAAQVRGILTATFRGLPPERDLHADHADDGHTPAAQRLQVNDSLRDENGRVDPYRLVAATRSDATRRPAQDHTNAAVWELVNGRRDGLVEAPTGSGKSMVLLASALDWVASDPDRRAIISTFTKQLQSQLADDLNRLAGVTPQLRTQVDLVKGAANRLSLRALATTLTGLATGAPHRARLSPRAATDPAFQDLAAYLLLRLVDTTPSTEGPPRIVDMWAARSVDRVDLPGAFDQWCGGQLGGYLAEFSQGRTGDYDATAPLAAYTLRVREALGRRRLIVANHALLCSTTGVLDELARDGDLLLLIDEAHQLEDAATSTMSAELDYAALEALSADLERLVAHRSTTTDARGAGTEPAGEEDAPPQREATFVAAVGELVALLRSEQLPAAVAAAFGMRSGADLQIGRHPSAATIADLDADGGQLSRATELERLLRVLVGRLASVAAAVDGLPGSATPEEADDLASVRARLVHTLAGAAAVRSDLAELVGVDDPATGGSGDGTVTNNQLALFVADTDVDAVPTGQAFNRIVWARESRMEGRRLKRFIDSGMSLRWWPFMLVTSPVEVSADPRWQTLRGAATVTVFTSGTLTVPGAEDPWAFIRARLGLGDEVAAAFLPSDFDPAAQALLVAFSDFPSWAEQPTAAVATAAWQMNRYAREVVTADGHNGALVLTTSRAVAGDIFERLTRLRLADDCHWIHSAILDGNAGATTAFREHGGMLVGTRGLWQGIDLEAERLKLVWVNKLPFPPVGDPVLEARRSRVERDARDAGSDDPENAALVSYYLPMAAMALRQAVGRLLRSPRHRGVVVISDPKLGGEVRLRRLYRRMFLESLGEGWAVEDPETGEPAGGNVTTMEDGWARIWRFLARNDVGALAPERTEELCTAVALAEHVWLEETRTIRTQQLTDDDVATLRARGELVQELLRREAVVGGALKLQDHPVKLHDRQVEALTHLIEGRDVLAILPTGYGKSFLFQLPGLVLPGVTVVVSPLVSLMTDQALKLNRTVGGSVRALVGPMRESNSRLGKAQVLQQLTGERDHGIKLVYLSPERLASRQFQAIVERGVAKGVIRLVAFDEAHTLAAWGDSFRPAIRRAEHFIRSLRATHHAPQLLAVTATATLTVRHHLLAKLFDVDPNHPDRDRVAVVIADPIRSDLATYKRLLPARRSEADVLQVMLVEKVLDAVDGHAIVYCTTIKEVERVHGYLSGQTGRRRRVLKYHGRMDDLERASVANFFASAPTIDDPDGSKPMVVVATQAFGLGIDRGDIRLVLCASPPGDLSALYQALGRAGRDQANWPPQELKVQTVGAAVLTPKAWGTLQWMNRHDPATSTLVDEIARRILHGTSPLDVETLVNTLICDGIDAGRLPASAADDEYLSDAFRSLVIRTFATLADRSLIDDLGDSPVRATIRAGERLDSDHSDAATLARIVLKACSEAKATVDMEALWAALPDKVRGEFGDVGGMWYELLALYATGHIDVSQRSNIGYGQSMNYRVNSTAAGPDLVDELTGLQRARMEDLQLLREWFSDDDSCALDGLGDYFQTPTATAAGICDHSWTRCSSCWEQPHRASEPRPPLLQSLLVDIETLRSSLGRFTTAEQRRVERVVDELLALGFGLGIRKLLAAVKGEEVIFYGRRALPLRRQIVASRWFGQLPQVTNLQLERALQRLVGRGRAMQCTADHGGTYFQHATSAEPDDEVAEQSLDDRPEVGGAVPRS